MTIPKDLKYTKTHEWARIEGNVVTVGITDFAVSQINEVIFLEIPQKGKAVTAEAAFGTVESVKAVFDLNSPISGTVIDVNAGAAEKPDMIAKDPYGTGWMIKVQAQDLDHLDHLMDASAYEQFLTSTAAAHH